MTGHLLPEDIGQDSPDDEDNSEEEKDDEVCEDEALDLLPGGKAAKDREKREDDGDDEHDSLEGNGFGTNASSPTGNASTSSCSGSEILQFLIHLM